MRFEAKRREGKEKSKKKSDTGGGVVMFVWWKTGGKACHVTVTVETHTNLSDCDWWWCRIFGPRNCRVGPFEHFRTCQKTSDQLAHTPSSRLDSVVQEYKNTASAMQFAGQAAKDTRSFEEILLLCRFKMLSFQL